ncbi:hypothetical protein [Herbaspirillum rubrisubalbicans]|uniref:Uncharacterized protein n=1 Tax=Herbaspirillum rubrisubalbicans TaxID=80842 RepID=A0AAD0XFU6_9BURK|nr:hypothetical protein [Herbaspirillum rubrisubalbicans]AYR22823.1 hypothetical protein RC54_02865 [Herbaspirillum rubrisubalbicans]
MAVGLFTYFNQPTYGRCESFTKDLRGGKKDFHGAVYEVKLCGADITNGTKIRLQVFDRSGDLVAQRYFSYYLNSATERDLAEGTDSIIYFDSARESPMQSISMPPTKWDWISARLPLF